MTPVCAFIVKKQIATPTTTWLVGGVDVDILSSWEKTTMDIWVNFSPASSPHWQCILIGQLRGSDCILIGQLSGSDSTSLVSQYFVNK